MNVIANVAKSQILRYFSFFFSVNFFCGNGFSV